MKLVFHYEPHRHRNTTGNQTMSHKTTKSWRR